MELLPGILPATEPEHLEEIRRLAHSIWREHYPGIIPRAQIEYMLEMKYSLEALRRDVRERGVHYDRAFVGGRPVGYAAYGPLARSGETMLHGLYVRAELRRRGLGALLLERALDHARRHGSPRVVLTVNRRNHTAIAAYRRWGFRVRGPLVTDIGGGFVMDDHAMELDV